MIFEKNDKKPLVECYLRQVDKDQEDILICEVFRIAISASENTRNFKTTKADAFLASVEIDQYKNVEASFSIKENLHSVLLNRRLTGRFSSLDKTKTCF